MAAVKGKNTSPEVALRRALYAAGVRGWRCHYKRAPGRPDIAWPGRKVAVFVDGAFWHGHPWRYKAGRSAGDWDDRIARNIERDREDDLALVARGWRVLRLWDLEIKRDLANSVEKVATVLDEAVRNNLPSGVIQKAPVGSRYSVGDVVFAQRDAATRHERAIVRDVRVIVTPETRARQSERIEQVLVAFDNGQLRLLVAEPPAVRSR
jgi:DNA mismatch endonuclease (patch repair protein)